MTPTGRGARKLSGPLLLLVLAQADLPVRAAGSPGSGCGKEPRVPKAAAPSRDEVFKAEIRPILVAHCAPCHEPGGKLYAKLPFDDPAVLSSHEAGVRKRLKGDDLKAYERWLAMAPGKT